MSGILENLGLTIEEVREAALRAKPLSPEAVRRAAVRMIRKGHQGRKGLPGYAIETMYADYQRLNSLEKVGKIYGRSRQSIFGLFKGRGLALRPKEFQPKIHYRGRNFTPGKHGYYRATTGDRAPLHHLMWMDYTGRTIPQGWQVSFKNGDCSDFARTNLICLPINEVTLQHYGRRFKQRAKMTPEQRREWWKTYYREQAREKSKAFRARGLRCDGRKLKNPNRRQSPGVGRTKCPVSSDIK